MVRKHGKTVILRFAYTKTSVSNPPYGDATHARVIQHIQSLRDVFHNNEGVIATVQAGFIGIWGEYNYGHTEIAKQINDYSEYVCN